MNGLHIGTSDFTAAGWNGSFYPEGMKPADHLNYYAQKFGTVEVDSTYYGTPSATMVKGWYTQTPKNFLFALKIVQTITHEKGLADCEDDLKHFLSAADLLKKAFPDGAAFFARFEPFLKKVPSGYRFAVEIRNKYWLVPKFADMVRARGIALALIDQPSMPRPGEVFKKLDPITADFTYIPLLGDRKGIERETETWDKTILNRKGELSEWVEIIRKVHQRRVQIFAYANNHYAGHAPATVRELQAMLEKK